MSEDGLTDAQRALSERISDLNLQKLQVDGDLGEAKRECERAGHCPAQHGESRFCVICRASLGWWCPTGPENRCDYTQADGSTDHDSCRYCGQPDERK